MFNHEILSDKGSYIKYKHITFTCRQHIIMCLSVTSHLPFAVISWNMYSVRINHLHWKPSIIKSLTVFFFLKLKRVLRANKAVSKIQKAFRFSPPEGRHLCLQHVHRVAAGIAPNPLLISFPPTAMYLPRCSQLGLFVVFFSGLIPAVHEVAINFVAVSLTPSLTHYACIYCYSLALAIIM